MISNYFSDDPNETYEADNVLEALSDSRILSIDKDGEYFKFTEACDYYFCAKLSKKEVQRLIEQLNELIK